METINRILKWLGECFKVEEDKALHENKLFWIVVLIPLFFIIWISWILTTELITKSIYSPHISAESLAGFVNYYAFPIALLTVPLTLAVMINRFHSSKQKAKSNRLVEQNNTANNFFNHYKYFKDHCIGLEKRFLWLNLQITAELLYKKLFPISSVSNFTTELDKTFVESVFVYYEDMILDYQNHIKINGIKTIAQSHNQGEIHEETVECHILCEPYELDFDLCGISFGQSLKVEEDFKRTLYFTFEIIAGLFCFSGVSNFDEVYDYYYNKFNTMIDKNI